MREARTIVGLGEVLWDLLPQGKQLGGAPANFAYMASLLGHRGIAASRIGGDELGKELTQKLAGLGLEESFLQSDGAHATGTAAVHVDGQGQAAFEITKNVAWDFLEWTPAWERLAGEADAVCFGSLAQRSRQSRETIRKFLSASREGALRIFDVNLRQKFYSPEILSESLRLANVVKLNDAELPIVAEQLHLEHDEERAAAESLRRAFRLRLVCVTRGNRGSLLVSESGSDEHAGFPVRVADSVGAGDAFTAALAHHLLKGSPLRVINDAANRLGAWVASHAGATPQADAALAEILAGTYKPGSRS
ncbi:MAG TPA: carbohydrate kinase [Candidatus Limnocylindrales bacterium]|nr:carbohydrate kinase [Candidatus Limnocylindrales bacterium]